MSSSVATEIVSGRPRAISRLWDPPAHLGLFVTAPLMVALASVLKVAVAPLVDRESPFVLFNVAIALSAWIGGLRVGLAAVFLAAFTSAFLFFEPAASIVVTDPGQRVRLVLFVIEGCGLVTLTAALQAARRLAEGAERDLRVLNARLEERVEARTLELAHALKVAESASKTKSEFLSFMSHEVRTPLTPMIGLCDLLMAEHYGPLTDKQRQYVLDIREASTHLLDLLTDLIDLSRVEVGRLELRLARVNLAALVRGTAQLLEERARAASLELATDLGEVPVITADARRVRQVLLNLLTNAIKYTAAGGHVKVALRAPPGGSTVVLSVVDDGVGISPEDQARLFRDFARATAGTGREREGVGLGLSLTKRLVELHGGGISVVSTPGRGSTFRVVLPVEPPRGTQ